MTIFQVDFMAQPEATPAAAAGGDLFISLIILACVGVVLLVIFVLFIARFFIRRNALGRTGDHELVVLRVLLPKFRREEEAERALSIDQVRESISVAESFFASIGGLRAERGFKQWFYGRTDEISFEIVVHNKLIWFYIGVPLSLQEHVEQQLSSVYPDAFVEEVEDYNIFSPTGTILSSYLVFKRPNAFPIKTYMKLESDPLNALTNALSKVPEGEGAAIQFVVRSARKQWRHRS